MLADKGERIKDERVHAFLLIQNEVLRLANASWERKYTCLLERTDPKRSNDQESFSFNRPLFMYPTPHKKTINYQLLQTLTPEKTVIIESPACHQLVAEKFPYICIDIMQQKFNRYSYVQQTLLNILPRLAAFDKTDFVQKHLPGSMNYLFNMLRSREKERNMAFIAVG